MKIAMRLLDAAHFRCLNMRGTLLTVQKALRLFNVFVDFTNRFVWYRCRWVILDNRPDYTPPENKPKPIFQPSVGCLGVETLNKPPYSTTTPCKYTADQVMEAVETNFAGFANYKGVGNIAFHQSEGAYVGEKIPISVGAGPVDPEAMSVTVSSMSTQSMTFRTNHDHVFAGEITFAASTASPDSISFNISVEGKIYHPLAFKFGGSRFEDEVWNHFLAQVRKFCTGGA